MNDARRHRFRFCAICALTHASCASNRFTGHEMEPLTSCFFGIDEMKEFVERLGCRAVDLLVRYPYPEVERASEQADPWPRTSAPPPSRKGMPLIQSPRSTT